MYTDQAFLTSKDPLKQKVIDYMSSYGVQIKKHAMFYYLAAVNIKNPTAFMQQTGYHGIIHYSTVCIKKDPPYGKTIDVFATLDEAYKAIEYLYNIMISPKSDADF